MGYPKTIVHIIDSLECGGAQRLLTLIAKHIPVDKYRLIIVSLQENVAIADQFDQNRVKLISFKRQRPSILSPWRFFRYVVSNLKDIIELCIDEKADVIHCHLSDSEFLGVFASIFLGIKDVYITVHVSRLFPEHPKGDFRLLLRKVMMSYLYRRVKGIISVSEDVRREILDVIKIPPSKVFKLTNGIDTSIFEHPYDIGLIRTSLNINEHAKLLLNVGRLTEAKGQVYLIEAINKLRENFPDVKLLIAGEGELRELLERKVNELKLNNNVVFLGVRNDIPQLLAASDLFVFPSIHEGTPLSLLEAMAAGKPIVTTDIPPHREILTHMDSALMVPPADSYALATAIEKLLKCPDLGMKLARNAKKIAKSRFDINHMMEQLIKIWG